MKLHKHLLLLTALSFSALLYGQTPEEPKGKDEVKNVVKLNFDGLFDGRYQFGYERVVGKYTSVQLNLGLLFDYEYSESSTSVELVDNYTRGFVLSPEMRVYLSEFTNDNPPKGFFVGVFGRYRDYEEQELYRGQFGFNQNNRDVRTIGMGLHLGFQYYTSFGVGFDAWIGPEFRYRTEEFVGLNQDSFDPAVIRNERSLKEQETVVFAGLGVNYAF